MTPFPPRALASPRALALAPALALAACSSSPSSYYALGAVPGPAQGGGPAVVAVRTPEIAGYLDRNSIVRDTQDYRLQVASTEVWAEPLDGMIGRVLSEDLQQRLPGTLVQPSSFGGAAPDVVVQLNVQRFDAAAGGQVTLLAQVSLQRGTDTAGASTDGVRLTAQAGGPGTASMVAAMSALLGQLADRIAARLRGAPGT